VHDDQDAVHVVVALHLGLEELLRFLLVFSPRHVETLALQLVQEDEKTDEESASHDEGVGIEVFLGAIRNFVADEESSPVHHVEDAELLESGLALVFGCCVLNVADQDVHDAECNVASESLEEEERSNVLLGVAELVENCTEDHHGAEAEKSLDGSPHGQV